MIGKLAILVLIPGLAMAGDRPAPDELDCVFQPGKRSPQSWAVDPSGVRSSALTHDFDDFKGPVPAHRHANGGGWVADTAKVEDRVIVDEESSVGGSAQVVDFAQVVSGARIFGQAKVSGGYISGRVRIKDAQINWSLVATDEMSVVDIAGNGVEISNSIIVSRSNLIGNPADVGETSKVVGGSVHISASLPMARVNMTDASIASTGGGPADWRPIFIAMEPLAYENGDEFVCNLSKGEMIVSNDQVAQACEN